ncbi:DUF6796 family protein [Streptomyces noursei]|uniref:Uncharacterized protein n=1 Tax=Streptomyces noursei TaxID=1971 RepID=A0A2N8PAT6_STRNR|nr:DUF6796 family protein [Streptomyces noursei]PNE38120.1 hypothetical protein AOB60_28795 [Streptomyces noursei]
MLAQSTHHAQQSTHINSRDTQVTWTRTVRLAGICGILASIAWLLGDILLLGKPMASSDRYPILGAYDGVTGDSLAAMLPASTTRLAWGALLGVLTGPLYLAACWHLYRGLRPARRLLSLPPFLLLATGFVLAPFVHGSFFYWGQAAKAVHDSGSDSPTLTALPGDFATVLFIPYALLLACWLTASLWMTVAILRGATSFPRWMCAATPLVCILIGQLLAKGIPGPAGVPLQGAHLSLANLMFFTLTTITLWNAHRRTAASASATPQDHAGPHP